ncbi:MAG: DUF805 domain-containing protein [Sphingomonadales bacterium]|nr:DUF805 domain-containing protein [Sphingomonadales bacterium]
MEWMLLPYKRYFDFKGRSRRKEYWLFMLFNLIVAGVFLGPIYVSILSAAFNAAGKDPQIAQAAMADAFTPGIIAMAVIGGLFMLVSFIPNIAVTIRRLHDRDMSGWWYLGYIVSAMIPLINLIAFIAGLVLMCLEGTRGPNRFGSDPLDPTSAGVFD